MPEDGAESSAGTDRRYCPECDEVTLHRLAGDTIEFGEDWRCQPCRAEREAEAFGEDLPTPGDAFDLEDGGQA